MSIESALSKGETSLKIQPHPADLLLDAIDNPLPAFLEHVDDLVVIHTHDRHELIPQEILAFITNREGFRMGNYHPLPPFDDITVQSRGINRNILFAVIDDSDSTPSDIYRDELAALADSITATAGLRDKYRVAYIDKEHQKALISACEAHSLQPYVHDYVSGKMGGIRAIQNISEVVLNFYAGFALNNGKVPIAHKFNDDISPESITRVDGNLVVANRMDFFARTAKVLKDKNVRIVGRHPDDYQPLALAHLDEIAEIVEHLDFERSNYLTHEMLTRKRDRLAELLEKTEFPGNNKFIEELNRIIIAMEQKIAEEAIHVVYQN